MLIRDVSCMRLHVLSPTPGQGRQPGTKTKWTSTKTALGTPAQHYQMKTTKKSAWKIDQESERPGRGPSSSWGHELLWPLKAEAWKTGCTVRSSTERTAKRPHRARRQRTRFVCRPSSSSSRQSSWSSSLFRHSLCRRWRSSRQWMLSRKLGRLV